MFVTALTKFFSEWFTTGDSSIYSINIPRCRCHCVIDITHIILKLITALPFMMVGCSFIVCKHIVVCAFLNQWTDFDKTFGRVLMNRFICTIKLFRLIIYLYQIYIKHHVEWAQHYYKNLKWGTEKLLFSGELKWRHVEGRHC